MNLPDYNRLVIAHLVGGKEHSGMCWYRNGYHFMVRWKDAAPGHVVADSWARDRYEEALRLMGADYATVEHWAYLEDVRKIMTDVRDSSYDD